ncbi:class I SAM-dependent methyltransferase [Streptomyces sp. bgisy100]|uniref:class I SAM-dependent methyltransferase n=1 Tax=Streptomyces sp. bgisy100 TaxID=3413783 RepID=UPI003D73EB6A
MPTTPPVRPGDPAYEPHRFRQAAESFGTDAQRYDRARPRYPDALVERIVAGGPGPDLLDVGCGTGIASRQFQAAGCRVLGVEPDERMAEVARRLGGTEVDTATFEAWDPAGRKFDAVVAGQAWHWLDPVAGAAKAARILRPGGRLAAFWNVFQLPREVAEAFAAACRQAAPDVPFLAQAVAEPALDGYQPLFVKAIDGMRAADAFGEPERWRFDWDWTYTRDAWLDQMPTQGAFTRLPPEKLAQVLEGVGTAIDGLGGSFTMRYTTVAVTATRTGGTRPGNTRPGITHTDNTHPSSTA